MIKKIFRARVLEASTCLGILFSLQGLAQGTETPLDPTLKVSPREDATSTVFQDMAVVQRRAFKKDGRFLLSSYFSMDFSDGPYSIYSFNFNPGYALSDFWEIYVNVAPYFINSERSIVGELRSFGVGVASAKAKTQYGAELLWAPLYGKDSLGSTRVVRSDTFFKLGVMRVNYDIGSGMKYHAALGKSYFLGKYFAFRPVVSANYLEGIRNGKKKFRFVGMVETGFVTYF